MINIRAWHPTNTATVLQLNLLRFFQVLRYIPRFAIRIGFVQLPPPLRRLGWLEGHLHRSHLKTQHEPPHIRKISMRRGPLLTVEAFSRFVGRQVLIESFAEYVFRAQHRQRHPLQLRGIEAGLFEERECSWGCTPVLDSLHKRVVPKTMLPPCLHLLFPWCHRDWDG